MSDLFEKIGGTPAVDAAVDLFYKKVLADERIKHFFDGVNMERQAGHQRNFLTYAFGGAPNYSGTGMRQAHKNLVEGQGLNDIHFDAVLQNLGAAMAELGVPDALIDKATGIAETTRADILNK